MATVTNDKGNKGNKDSFADSIAVPGTYASVNLNGTVYDISGDRRVCLWSYADRNNGFGNWLWVAVDGMDGGAIGQLMEDYGQALTDATGELHEEIFVCDSEGIHPDYTDTAEAIAAYLDAVEEHGADMVTAAVECDIPLEDISDAYAGQSDSSDPWADYAEECVNEGLFGPVPDGALKNYIDYASIGKDLEMDMTGEWVGGTFYIFNSNY